ncbi:hypothetical protein ES703_53123 [subsurface metagenome]
MKIVDYPFIRAGEADPRPALFVRLISPSDSRGQDSIGIIDTGAYGYCVPAGYAEILGLDPSSGVERIVRTANGKITGYEHNCGLKVWDSDEYLKGNKVLVCEVSEIPVLFLPNLTEILLGVSFLKEKVLTINYNRKVFSLRKP